MTALDDETITTVRSSLAELFAKDPDTVIDALDDLGWSDIVAADSVTATVLLFEEQGRALASTRLLDSVVMKALAPLGLPDTTNVAYDSITLGPITSDTVLLLSEDRVSTVPADALAGRVHDATGFDRSGPWRRLDLAARETTLLSPEADLLARTVADARLALAAEIVGVCEAAVQLTVAHTSLRQQYGRPLATFQAVRHGLAESYAATEHARVTVTAALVAARDESDCEAITTFARLAKHRAGAAQAIVMRNAVQLHGAMGLTLESDVHRYVSRAGVLDILLGSHVALAHRLGEDLLAGGSPRALVAI